MLKYLFIFLIPLALHSQQTMPTQDALTAQMIDQWYGQLGLEGYVPKNVFELALRGNLYYAKQGSVSKKNQFIIVNYQNPRSSKHFFWIQITPTPKIIFSSGAAYGVAGEAFGARQCIHQSGIPHPPIYDNTGGSRRTPTGFLRTAGVNNTPAFPISTKVAGLESENRNAMSRMIRIHPNALGGHTQGCIGLDRSLGQKVHDVINQLSASSILIYISDGQDQKERPFSKGRMIFSQEDVAGISGQDTTIADSAPLAPASSLPDFQDAGEPQGDVEFGGAGVGSQGGLVALAGLAGMALLKSQNSDDDEEENTFSEEMTNSGNTVGTSALHGTKGFEECQARASAPWCDVIAEAKKDTGDISKFFKGTYLKLEKDAPNYLSPTDAIVKNMAIDNQAANERCMALARMTKDTPCSEDNINSPKTYTSKDNAITCQYESPESQDWTKCKELVDTYNQSLVDEADLKEDQKKAFIKLADEEHDKAKSGENIQTSIPALQKSLTQEKENIASVRSEFQTAKLESLNTLQAAMPNRNSILSDCKSYMSGRNLGRSDLKAFITTLPGAPQGTPLPSFAEPCTAATRMLNTNLVQNIPARKQAIVAIEKAGLKALSLDGKQRTFMNRGQMLNNSSLSEVNNSGFDNFKAGKVKGSRRIKFNDNSGTSFGCSGSNCNYEAGSGKGSLGGNRNGSSGTSSSTYNLASYSPTLKGSHNGSVQNGRIQNFDSSTGQKARSGVFKEDFYKNVNLALRGKYPVNKLSASQKREYYSVLDFKKGQAQMALKNNGQLSSGNSQGQKGKNGVNQEIWFNTKHSLFDIISNRYQRVFNKE